MDNVQMIISAYKQGIEEQKAEFERLCKTGEASDGYHTFNELYDFRREYNAALVNSKVWKSYKSKRHADGELCFGGDWFIVVIETPNGQISNHYEIKYWDEFNCPERETSQWDGHTEKDVLNRLHLSNLYQKTTWICTQDKLPCDCPDLTSPSSIFTKIVLVKNKNDVISLNYMAYDKELKSWNWDKNSEVASWTRIPE